VLGLGIEPAKVDLIFPPVDLARFQSKKKRELSGSPTVLFASSPRTREEMKDRGVNLLLDAAQMKTAVTWRMLYRRWRSNDTAYESTENLVREGQLSNVHLQHENVSDMLSEYESADFVVIPFICATGGKPCPNSMVEGLACGLPVLISPVSPMADFVRHHRCGIVFQPTAESLNEALDRGCDTYATLSKKSLEVAKSHFSQRTYVKKIAAIYDKLSHRR
jgi:glycosyltransferase involved in cell wall biosynthesis